MLSASSVTFQYNGASPLIDNLNFHLQAGEIVGLPGRSGIGKSTFALMLSGILHPLSGKITCNNQGLPKNGYCPVQLIFQHPEMAINPRWKISRVLEEGNAAYPTMYEKFGLHADMLDRYSCELSGGELQRIALIRVMNENTRYIIADEITASLDASTQALIWTSLIPWAKKKNVGILSISHDRKLLERICDRIDYSFEQ